MVAKSYRAFETFSIRIRSGRVNIVIIDVMFKVKFYDRFKTLFYMRFELNYWAFDCLN